MISSEIKRNGKQANVSMFAFTATPKPTTIQLFGHQNTKGQKEAFHVYSMKQAIEEDLSLMYCRIIRSILLSIRLTKKLRMIRAVKQMMRNARLHVS